MVLIPRIVNRPVTVTLSRGRPVSFRDGRRRRAIAHLLDSWREGGQWWAGEGGRTVYRVELRDRGVCELEIRHDTGRWTLYRVYD